MNEMNNEANTAPTVRIAGVVSDSIVDGPGLRLVLFFQGCHHHCPGCHNPETHDFEGGTLFDLEDFTEKVVEELKANPLLAGVTFSGGEPICQYEAMLYIAKQVRAMNRNIVIFTGYTFEELVDMNKPEIMELLKMTTLLVDGRFELEKRNLEIKFRGSTNQRLINPIASIEQGEIVMWKSKFDF